MSAKAQWYISLDCECPSCEHDIDLTRDPDLWGDHGFDVGEHDTPRSRGIEVVCPKCKHEFEVDLEY